MSMEAKLLLADLEQYGAKVVLKDDQPRLIGGEKVPQEMKALLKANRDEIIALLQPPVVASQPKVELFETPVEASNNSGLDIQGKRERGTIRKVVREELDESWIVMTVVCAECFNVVEGRYRRGPNVMGYHALESIFQHTETKKWICLKCDEKINENRKLEVFRSEVSRMNADFAARQNPDNAIQAGKVLGRKNYYTGETIR